MFQRMYKNYLPIEYMFAGYLRATDTGISIMISICLCIYASLVSHQIWNHLSSLEAIVSLSGLALNK